MKALVTGASSGIGRDMAKELAKRGYNLILVARDEQKLKEVSEEIKNIYKVEAKVIQKDLSIKQNCIDLYNEVKSEDIDILINNAGFGVHGNFVETNFEKEIFKENNLETPEYIYEKCGCEHCNRGYIGRTLILESLILDDEIKEIINGNCNSGRLYEYFKKNGNESLLRKIADGITSFEEVNKILFSLGEF